MAIKNPGIELKNYDGSYCPNCKSQEVEIIDNDHDFGYLELQIKCNSCNCKYTSTIKVSKNKLILNQVDIVELEKK